MYNWIGSDTSFSSFGFWLDSVVEKVNWVYYIPCLEDCLFLKSLQVWILDVTKS